MPLFTPNSSCPLRHPHSFPTRRSSDLTCAKTPPLSLAMSFMSSLKLAEASSSPSPGTKMMVLMRVCLPGFIRCTAALTRSEEHTSELQSPCNLVCRLLLEKKNPRHELG